MLPKSKTVLKRAKPLLGTFVEVTLCSDLATEKELSELAASCFRRVAEIQAKMSFFDARSDISRINCARPGSATSVSRDTVTVLRFADALYRESHGAFDSLYMTRKQFPEAAFNFIGEDAVSLSHAAKIDLGGIAKGFAVDHAAEFLKDNEDISGVINAGGDIRFFGARAFPLHLRSPKEDGSYFDSGMHSNCAVATSVFNRDVAPQSISVFARSCMVADALTKVVFGMTASNRESLLTRYGARYLSLETHSTHSDQLVAYES